MADEIATWAARYRERLTVPDLSEPKFIDGRNVYVPPAIIRPGKLGPDALAEATGELIGISDLAAGVDRTILVGDAGAGKSTIARALVRHWAADLASVPFLIERGPFARTRQRPAVATISATEQVIAHIEEQLNTVHECPPPPGAVEQLLQSGAARVIFDGFDQVPGPPDDATETLSQFCNRYPSTPVLVTTGAGAIAPGQHASHTDLVPGLDRRLFGVYAIGHFNNEEVTSYVYRYFTEAIGVPRDTAARQTAVFMRESGSLADLRANPLMLATMCGESCFAWGVDVRKLHGPDIHSACVDHLLHRPGNPRRDQWAPAERRSAERMDLLLPAIAWWASTTLDRQDPPMATRGQLLDQTTNRLLGDVYEGRQDATAAAAEFIDFCIESSWILRARGATSDGQPLYAFAYPAFQRYYTAWHLFSSTDTSNELAHALAPYIDRTAGPSARPVADPACWDEVGLLAVAIKDKTRTNGAAETLTALLHDPHAPKSALARRREFAASYLQQHALPPRLAAEIANTRAAAPPSSPGRSSTGTGDTGPSASQPARRSPTWTQAGWGNRGSAPGNTRG